MSAHTPGPWVRDGLSIYAFMHAGWRRGAEEIKNRFYLRIYGDRECPEEETEANARLIAAAPAMDLALRLISEGHARIEKCGSLREFCFDGIRYSMNGDWNGLIDVIGWDKAIAKATVGTP